MSEVDLEGDAGGARPPYFLQLLLFCNHFEELQTVLFEEPIVNNAPLTCVYPNTIETCSTPNHLLFERQLFYSFNTRSTDQINRIIFGISGDMNYVVNLHETLRTSTLNINSQKTNVNDILC